MCASSWSNTHANLSSVGFYALVDHRKSYAGTAYMPSRRHPALKKWFENVFALIARDTGPLVHDVDHDALRFA